MTKKKTPAVRSAAKRPAIPTRLKPSLKRLTRQIVQLCNERAQLVQQAGFPDSLCQWLQSELVDDLVVRQKGPLAAGDLRAILGELDGATRALAQANRVAFLGPEFSYSHLAAIHYFGRGGELVPASTIGGVFESVERGDATFGVVPIENSTDGRVVDTLDRFVRSPLRICGEVPMPIHHNLLAVGRLGGIREVHSKPQAL